MEQIVLTGGTGYVGSHLKSSLQKAYHVDVAHYRAEDAEFEDLTQVDALVHLAGVAHGKGKRSNFDVLRVNTLFPIRLAKHAKECGVKSFIFLSSTSVYDNSLKVVCESSQCNPESIYGWSKLLAEQGLLALASSDFRVVVLRAPMIYGKSAPGNPARLVERMRQFKVLPLGEIRNKRSFLSIDNLVLGINKVLQTTVAGVFCIADDESMSTTDLVSILARIEKIEARLISMGFLSPLLRLVVPEMWRKLCGDSEVHNAVLKDALGLGKLPTL